MASLGSTRQLGGVVAALLLLAGWAGPAKALSFEIPEGAQVTDIDTGSSATPSGYDGTTETFNIVSDVRVIRIDMDPWEIQISGGEVQLTVQLALQGTILDVGPALVGDYAYGAADFVIIDVAGGNQVIFAADFDADAPLQLSAPLWPMNDQIVGGTLGGGMYTKIDLSNPFDDAMPPIGTLGIQLNSILVGGSQATKTNIMDGSGGLNTFDFNPVSDLSPIPEPGSSLLLGAGLLALAAWRRRIR